MSGRWFETNRIVLSKDVKILKSNLIKMILLCNLLHHNSQPLSAQKSSEEREEDRIKLETLAYTFSPFYSILSHHLGLHM